MYFGETAINLDAKGRLAIPTRYRELIAEQCAGLQRRLVGSATPVEPDGSGRIQLPLTLRQVAGLEKHVVFLGMGSRFEIWNETTLGQKRREEEMSINEQASEEMAKLVL